MTAGDAPLRVCAYAAQGDPLDAQRKDVVECDERGGGGPPVGFSPLSLESSLSCVLFSFSPSLQRRFVCLY